MQVGDTLNLEELRAKQLADAQLVADSMELGQLNLAQPESGIIIIPAVFYFHPDHLGSSTLITDNFGDPYQFFLNLPFGETFAEQRRSGSFNNPYKFNGKELDEETGLYYYGARYYNPRTSVFISVDPLTEQTMTPYQYTYQNPINLVDPTGMAADTPDDWIRDNKTGKITWNASVTSKNNTPEGFDYIGANDQDIVSYLFGNSRFSATTKDIGIMGMEEYKGSSAAYHFSATTKLRVDIKAKVEYGKDGSRVFEGVYLDASINGRHSRPHDKS